MSRLRRRDELTLREWDEAWTHYRHLEMMRSQYLGFFFTAVLGVTAFAGPRLAAHPLRTQSTLLVSAVLLAGLQLLAGCLYLMVARLNEVLGLYEEKVGTLHQWMLDNGVPPDLEKTTKAPRAPRDWSDHGSIVETVFQVGLFVFALAPAAILYRAIGVRAEALVMIVCAVSFVVSASVVVWVLLGRTAAGAYGRAWKAAVQELRRRRPQDAEPDGDSQAS